MSPSNPMVYLPGMEVLDESTIMPEVIDRRSMYDPRRYTAADIQKALSNDRCTLEDFAALLSPAAIPFLEEVAQRAQAETRRHFGNSISMFTPLYLANYCENQCVYCGFSSCNKIRRSLLKYDEMEREMLNIAATGLEEVLLLTGESWKLSNVEYIGKACEIARRFFKMVGLEVYPMNSEDYAYLHSCGADYVTVFQETYDTETYANVHPNGRKRVFPYRMNVQERALRGGMRGVGFGALLGLGDFRKDALATGVHAWLLQRKYPQSEIAFSCPRLRPISVDGAIYGSAMSETELLQVILAYRILMPFAHITISTRERSHFRDHVVGVAATKISAGVSTGIGGHNTCQQESGDGQFEIADTRSVRDVYTALKEHGLQPVMNDYVYV